MQSVYQSLILSLIGFTVYDTRNYFITHTTTSKIYTLSLHDALPIYRQGNPRPLDEDDIRRVTSNWAEYGGVVSELRAKDRPDRKSTRLNSSHEGISYAVFCLKKKIGMEHLSHITCSGR